MPELPEVETVVRHLRPLMAGKVIKRLTAPRSYTRAVAPSTPKLLSSLLANQRIERITRRAKFIVLELTNGCLTVHLRMTGRLITKLASPRERKYVTATINFRDGSNLYFHDVRKFGRIAYHPHGTSWDKHLGVEPLSKTFTFDDFSERLIKRSRMIKPLLLDQSIIAGLGNIYVDEVLWAAKIHPHSTSDRISKSKLLELYRSIPKILRRSIASNGTTFSTFYFGDDQNGEFVDNLNVFGKDGTPCSRCGAKIAKIRVAQRGTHFCPRCQR